MTVDELLARESIRQTIVSYNVAGDRLRVDEFVANFAENGIFEIDGTAGEEGLRVEGREMLRNWFLRWGRGAKDANPVNQAKFIRHHLSTCHIEMTGSDTAKSRTYWTAYTDIGPDHGGYYLDTFRQTGERWLITHRKVRLDWSAPHSLYVKSLANLRQR
jgi:3-phenylpropionate/cinnamic acid dioxygenase small subunit